MPEIAIIWSSGNVEIGTLWWAILGVVAFFRLGMAIGSRQ